MCFFSAPSAPRIVYQGPSEEDVKRNQESLDQYRKQMGDQQAAFQSQLQQQIDAANQQTQQLKEQYQSDVAAASAASAQQQAGAYAVTATQTEAPQAAETTTVVNKKDKPASTLKIDLAGTPSTAGAGLNIGV